MATDYIVKHGVATLKELLVKEEVCPTVSPHLTTNEALAKYCTYSKDNIADGNIRI